MEVNGASVWVVDVHARLVGMIRVLCWSLCLVMCYVCSGMFSGGAGL